MKAGLLRAVALCTFATSSWGAPLISIENAVKLAQDSLRQRRLSDRVYIASAVLARSSLLGGKTYWDVRWSESLPREKRKKEIGMEIAMDGSVVIVVRAPRQK